MKTILLQSAQLTRRFLKIQAMLLKIRFILVREVKLETNLFTNIILKNGLKTLCNFKMI